MALVVLPRDVADMRGRQKGVPLLTRPWLDDAVAVHGLARPTAAVDEHPGVARIVEDAEHLAVLELPPDDVAPMRPGGHAARKPQPVLPEHADDSKGRGRPRERVEEHAHSVLDLLVGIQPQSSLAVVDKADGRARSAPRAGPY